MVQARGRAGIGVGAALTRRHVCPGCLQDCADDYKQLDRVYLPSDWMEEEGVAVDALAEQSANRQLRRVFRRCLKETHKLIADARKLPGHVASPRLAMESAMIVRIAHKLHRKLAKRDPLRRRVQLSKSEYLSCGLRGIVAGLLS